MERLTYKKHRGYHHHKCQVCGKLNKDRIPDQASDDYQHNPGNAILGLCINCNHGVGAGAIRLYPNSLPPGQKSKTRLGEGIDSDNDTSLYLSKRIPDLPGEWRKYAEIALKFEHKAKEQDQEDLRSEIILRLAEIDRKRNGKGEALTEAGMIRVASYVVMQYWEAQREITTGLDCQNCGKEKRERCRKEDLYSQCPKLTKIVSLYQEIEDGEGNSFELWETIADDKAIDLDAWIDANVFLESCPKRLIEIAHKKEKSEALTKYEQLYICRFRKNSQNSLFL